MTTPYPFLQLEAGMFAALETYSNVHRGSGHYSMVTTHLYERARTIVLDYLGLRSSGYIVIFFTLRRADEFSKLLKPDSFIRISSNDFGLNLGVTAMAVRKNALTAGTSFEPGGGTTKLYGPDWVIWAKAPDRFEAGTPAIINIIAFARALLMIRRYGKDIFREEFGDKVITANEVSENVAAGKEHAEKSLAKNERAENGTAWHENGEEVTARKILHEDHLTPFEGKELLNALRKTLIGHEVRVPTSRGLMPFTNLDNSASTPTFVPVWEAFRQTYRQPDHIRREIIGEVKGIIAETMGAPLSGYDILFTSNATEAINLAAQSLTNKTNPSHIDKSLKNDQASFIGEPHKGDIAYQDNKSNFVEKSYMDYMASHDEQSAIGYSPSQHDPVIMTSILEHSSNDLPWRQVAGHEVVRLCVDDMGYFNYEELEALLKAYNIDRQHGEKRIRLIAVSGASNVLGSCNDLAGIGRLAEAHGAGLFVDAAQLAAHQPIDMQAAGIDYLVFSAHKMYAPFGTGVLIARKGLLQSSPEEAKTLQSSAIENAGGIAALGKALLLLQRIGFGHIEEEEKRLTEKAMTALMQMPGMTVYGALPDQAPALCSKTGVIGFDIRNKMASGIAKKLARRGGIGVRMGCHCAHLIIKQLAGFTPFQEKLQKFILRLVPMLNLQGITRASFGLQNTEVDVDLLIDELHRITKTNGNQKEKTDNPGNKSVQNEITEKVVKQQMKAFIRSREQKVFQF